MPTKTQAFPPSLVALAVRAKALGHPARLAILHLLAGRSACVCGHIVDELPLAQATVSQHLKVLKAAGLVRGEVDGPRVCYCLDRPALAALRDELVAFADSLALDAPTPHC